MLNVDALHKGKFQISDAIFLELSLEAYLIGWGQQGQKRFSCDEGAAKFKQAPRSLCRVWWNFCAHRITVRGRHDNERVLHLADNALKTPVAGAILPGRLVIGVCLGVKMLVDSKYINPISVHTAIAVASSSMSNDGVDELFPAFRVITKMWVFATPTMRDKMISWAEVGQLYVLPKARIESGKLAEAAFFSQSHGFDDAFNDKLG